MLSRSEKDDHNHKMTKWASFFWLAFSSVLSVSVPPSFLTKDVVLFLSPPLLSPSFPQTPSLSLRKVLPFSHQDPSFSLPPSPSNPSPDPPLFPSCSAPSSTSSGRRSRPPASTSPFCPQAPRHHPPLPVRPRAQGQVPAAPPLRRHGCPLSTTPSRPTSTASATVYQVWVRTFVDPDGAVRFEADSDSALTKGLAALLVLSLSGSPTPVIARVPPEFVHLLGIRQSLTPSRNNGFLNMLKLMQQKALQL